MEYLKFWEAVLVLTENLSIRGCFRQLRFQNVGKAEIIIVNIRHYKVKSLRET